MNEAKTRAELIDPALKAAGWGVVEASWVRREIISLAREQDASSPSGHIHGSGIVLYPTRNIPRAVPAPGLRRMGSLVAPFQFASHAMQDMACCTMIRSWRDASTRRFAETGKSRCRGLDADVAKERLQALHAAKSLEGLGRLRSLGLHKLRGNRAGAWAMTINGPWRLVFRFRDGDAHDVEIVDYH
jgi:proteic killer suppression protein